MAGGRPSKIDNIDREVFERILSRFNPLDTTCYYLGVSKNTLRKWVKITYGIAFEEVEKMFQAKGRADLLDMAWNMAQKNPAVLIFLLKNFCGLSDDPKPVDTGEERREFRAAIKAATKALEGSDLSRIADIPDPEEEAEEDG